MKVEDIFKENADPEYKPVANLAPKEEEKQPEKVFSSRFTLPEQYQPAPIDERITPYIDKLKLSRSAARCKIRDNKETPKIKDYRWQALLNNLDINDEEALNRGIVFCRKKAEGRDEGIFTIDSNGVVFKRDELNGCCRPVPGCSDALYWVNKEKDPDCYTVLTLDPLDGLKVSKELHEEGMNVIVLPSPNAALNLPLEVKNIYILTTPTNQSLRDTELLSEYLVGTPWNLEYGHNVQEFIKNGGDLHESWERVKGHKEGHNLAAGYSFAYIGDKNKAKGEIFNAIPQDAIVTITVPNQQLMGIAWNSSSYTVKYDKSTFESWLKGFPGTIVTMDAIMRRELRRNGFAGRLVCIEDLSRVINPHRHADLYDLCISYTGFDGRVDSQIVSLEKHQDNALEAIAVLELYKRMVRQVPNHAFYQEVEAVMAILDNLPDIRSDESKYFEIISEWRLQEKMKAQATAWEKYSSIPLKYQPIGQPSGRFQTSDPNAHGAPATLRNAFFSRDGFSYVYADVKQCQQRIAAGMSGDEAYLKPFMEGVDIHKATAAKLFSVEQREVSEEQRKTAKMLNAAILFGAGAKKIAETLDIEISEAEKLTEQFKVAFEQLESWSQAQILFATQNGYVETATKRKILMPPNSFYYGTKAVNYAVTGTEVEIMTKALLKIDAALHEANIDGHIVFFLHDAIMLEVQDNQVELAKNLLNRAVTEAFVEILPRTEGQSIVEASSAKCWGELH